MCRMCQFFEESRSGYYDFVRWIGRLEKDAELADIIAAQRKCSMRIYGYGWNGKLYTAEDKSHI